MSRANDNSGRNSSGYFLKDFPFMRNEEILTSNEVTDFLLS